MMVFGKQIFRARDGAQHLLLGFGAESPGAEPTAHVLDLRRHNSIPVQVSISELQQRWQGASPWALELKRAKGRQLNKREAALQHKRWKLIEPLVNNFLIYWAGHRRTLVAARAQETGSSPETISRLLYKFWRSGMTPSALTAPPLRGRAMREQELARRD